MFFFDKSRLCFFVYLFWSSILVMENYVLDKTLTALQYYLCLPLLNIVFVIGQVILTRLYFSQRVEKKGPGKQGKRTCLSMQVWMWFVVMLVLQNLPYTTLSLHRVSHLWAFKFTCLSIQVWRWFVVMLVLQTFLTPHFHFINKFFKSGNIKIF